MRLRAILAGAALLPLLSACVVHVSDDGPRIVGGGEDVSIQTLDLEAVRSPRIEDGHLVLRVDSNGCTSADDFDFVYQEADDWTAIGVHRRSPHHCKALVPDGVELRWPVAAPGVAVGAETRLLNPLKF